MSSKMGTPIKGMNEAALTAKLKDEKIVSNVGNCCSRFDEALAIKECKAWSQIETILSYFHCA
jgi:hypothetical protein